jgi:3-phenylpropionate/trans-cinnamate dioxygenase ferredoxin subunit
MATTVRVCSLDDIPPGSHRTFDVGKVKICVVRIGDDVYAINDRCSHEDYSLCEGEIWEEEREIECWKHGSTFSLLTGEPQSLPATKPVPVYEVSVDNGDVVVTVA